MTTKEQAIEFLRRKILKDPYSADIYHMAIEALKVKWISVDERLPEVEEYVLVIVTGCPRNNITLFYAYELATYCPDEGWILEMYPEWETPDVSHWMPLPEPPKGTEE